MLTATEAPRDNAAPLTAPPSNIGPGVWALIALFCLVAPLVIFFGTSRSIVAIWNSSETFAHGYIILPISLWLLWRRRAELNQETLQTYWPALIALLGVGFGWLLAELADVQVVRQYAIVAMIPLAALAILGKRLTLKMAFPLAFLLFAVPFGEVFIEPLIEFTANFTVASLQATGIPVLRNGNTFEIPSGTWSVVEACSGVRYLIASITLGSLYAYLTYRSRLRQLMFMGLSVVVPIIANGMRAYMIVMIGHLSGMKLAVGVDHLIYGWLFFGLVMFLMFWIGGFWREDDQNNEAPQSNPAPTKPIVVARTSFPWTMAIVSLVCMGIWPLYAKTISSAIANPATPRLETFHSTWTTLPGFPNFRPAFFDGAAELSQLYQNNDGQVGMSLIYYRNQSPQSKLISSENKIVKDKDPYWRRLDTAIRHETISGHDFELRESHVQGATGTMIVWNFYWIDGRFTANDYLAKLIQAKQSLLMRGDDGAAIAVFATYGDHQDEARARMREFLAANLAGIEQVMIANRKP